MFIDTPTRNYCIDVKHYFLEYYILTNKFELDMQFDISTVLFHPHRINRIMAPTQVKQFWIIYLNWLHSSENTTQESKSKPWA